MFLIFSILLLNITNLNAQIKVAVLNFENSSNIKKYDGFGKAMSNMLLTDLKNNIHPRKISFLERSQLNKILNEQQLQNTKSFDKNTAVSFGKLAGVKYVILGSVYVLDGTCNLNSRMVDVESSEIIYAKESNGKISDWLNLKTKLAEELSSELNNPIKIEESYNEVDINEGTISQYSKVIELLEKGSLKEASDLLSILTSIQPDFKYLDELKFDLEELKKQVKKNTSDINVLQKSGGLVLKLNGINEYINNMKSDLIDFKEKRNLRREVFVKFEYESIIKKGSEIQFLLYKEWRGSNVNLLKVILEEDFIFIEKLESDAKKKLYLEMILMEVLYNIPFKRSVKMDLFNEIELISRKLFTLYNFNNISENEFLYLIFSDAFLSNEFGEESNDFLKSKLIYYLDFIDSTLNKILTGYDKKDLINKIKISFESKASFSNLRTIQNLISFGFLNMIAEKMDNDIFEKRGKIKEELKEEISREISNQFSPTNKDNMRLILSPFDIYSTVSPYSLERALGYRFKEN